MSVGSKDLGKLAEIVARETGVQQASRAARLGTRAGDATATGENTSKIHASRRDIVKLSL